MSVIDIASGIFMTWLVPAAIAVVISAPIVYSSWNRVAWHPLYLAVLVVPIGVWLSLPLLYPIKGKSMSNFVMEVGAIALSVPAVLLMRVLLGHSISTRWGVVGVVTAVSVVALVLYFAVPPLPE